MATRKKRLTLPATAAVTVIWSGSGPEVQVSGLKPKDAETALRWLGALWERRRFPVPGPDTVPSGNVVEVTEIDGEPYPYERKRAGFRA